MKKVCSVILALCLICSLAACNRDDESSGGKQERDYPVTVSGVTIQKAPAKAVVLSPCLADVIVACGYEILLCARSTDCIQAELQSLPDVGESQAPNIDAILEQKADIVLVDAAFAEADKTRLTEAGIPVVVIEPAFSRADFERLYTNVCSVLNGGKKGYEKGVKVSDSIFMSIDNVGRVIQKSDTPATACYVFNAEGEIATGDTLAGALLEAAGAINIAADNTEGIMDNNELSIANPAYIFCATGVKDALVQNTRFSSLSAVSTGQVIEIPPEYMIWQGKTVIEAVSVLAGHMYPQMDASSSSAPSSSEPVSSAPVSSDSPSSEETSSTAYTTLRQGDENAAVKALQERLKTLGYLTGNADGKYGSGTTAAVAAFQVKAGIKSDGIAGAQTQQKLFADNAPQA